MSSFRHCYLGEITRSPFILVHNIKEAGPLIEGLSGKVMRKMDAVVRVEDLCDVGCAVTTSNDAGMGDVREISTHPSSSQLQDRFRRPCVSRRTGWWVRRFTTGGIVGAMDLPSGPILE